MPTYHNLCWSGPTGALTAQMMMLMILTRMFVAVSILVSRVSVVGGCRDSLLGRGRIRASERLCCSPEPGAVPERLWQRTFQMTAVPELRALSPPHPSEDRLRLRKAPRQLWTRRDEDWSREAQYSKVQKRLENMCQVAFWPFCYSI